ncbi:MAG TPA: ABC transporter permease subunit [Thermomicrobiales bacterium]|nr:ABC transporter permease subunit [Thermomicrobiales bacterium]
MLKRMVDMVSAEVFQLRHRVGTWVLLAIWGVLALFFGYVFAYLIDGGETAARVPEGAFVQPQLLPDQFVATIIAGFPFYGGAFALMLGVLTVGSDFGWETFKTLFTQRPGRGQVFAAKMAALAIMLIPFVLFVFALGAIASSLIALREGLPIDFPGPVEIVQGMLAGWLILAVWATVGVVLAVVTRGTSLAIGIGILYTLVIEGLISNVANQISWMKPMIDGFVRANAYSLVKPFGNAAVDAEGPGRFAGPFVSPERAALVLVAYMVIFCGLSLWLLRTRDVD